MFSGFLCYNKNMKKLFRMIIMVAAVFAAGSAYVFAAEEHFPLIKIVSTENGGNNDFVTKPVAAHVKQAQQSWGDFSMASLPDPWYENCEISLDGKLIGPGQVKVRGNWTTSYDKKSLRIKLDKKANLCGLHSGEKYKNWVLLAAFKDASLLRDAVAFQLYRKLFSGYASDCCLVEVEVNGQNFGVYLLAEQQEAKRVGISEPEKEDKNTDIGYLIEFDNYYYTEDKNEQFKINYLGTVRDYAGKALADIQNGYTIKSDINDKAQHDFIADYMNKLWKICYEAVNNKKYYRFNASYELEKYTPKGKNHDEKCRACIEQIIDIQSLADMYIFNEIICDPDLYLTSFFMDIDFGEGGDKKLRFEAPWDFDSTMGNKNFCAATASRGNITGKYDMFAGLCQTDVNCEHQKIHGNPWMVIFIRQAWFQNLVKETWSRLPVESVSAELSEYIDKYSSDVFVPAYEHTRSLWGDPGDNWELCDASRAAAFKSQSASAAYLKEWLLARIKAVDMIIAGLK